MWNLLLELLFFGLVNGIFASYLVEIDLAKIALSCHVALDFLCKKEEVLAFERKYIGHRGQFEFSVSVAPLPSLRDRVWRVATTLCFTFYFLLLMLFSSCAFPYPSVVVVRMVTIYRKGDTLRSFGQGTTSSLTFFPKKLRR